MNQDRILISGASGFIGSNLIDQLKSESYCYWPLSRSDVKRWISNPEKFNTANFSLVHCAGYAHVLKRNKLSFDDKFEKINTELTLSIAKSAIKLNVKKFIYLSSISVFGRIKRGFVEDKQLPCPDDAYGISKYRAEIELEKLFNSQALSQCIILRLPMVYGPRNKGNMLSFLKAGSKGILLPLASTKGKRSILYVKNLCDAILRVLNDNSSNRTLVQFYFLNDGSDITSGELYDMISKSFTGRKGIFPFPENVLRFSGIFGSLVELIFRSRFSLNKKIMSSLFDEYRFSSETFRSDYNWSPPYTTDEGIKETVDWYKQNIKD